MISSFLWLVNALNRNYTKIEQIPIKYINLPANKIRAVDLPKFMVTEIKTSGAKMFYINFTRGQRFIEVDASRSQVKRPNQFIYALNTLGSSANLSKFFNTEVEAISVKPDSIYFSFGKSYKKVVPVKPSLMINFDPFYNYKNKVRITPSSVTLFGDSSLIAEIDSVMTEKIVLNDFNSNITQKAKIELPEKYINRIGLSVESVDLSINIDKYTEANITLSIQAKNLPEGYKLKSFPDKVSITYQVPMNEYETINEKMFEVSVDLSKGNKTKLKVDAKCLNPNVKITKISPEKVEYILRK